MKQHSFLLTISMAVALGIVPGARGGAVEDACGPQGTWSNCGVAVKQELDTNPTDPQRILQLALLWGQSYDAQFDYLRKQGRVDQSTPDSEKIFEAVKDKLDPIQIAKDQLLEDLAKQYVPRLATVLEFASSPLGQALAAFFNSSEIASDYDELRLMDDDLQQRFANLLASTLVADWKDQLKAAVTAAAPGLSSGQERL